MHKTTPTPQPAGQSPSCAQATGSGLSPFAESLLTAIRALSKECVPHPCGGFNLDDMRWRLGKIFEPDDTMHEAMEELLRAKLIRFTGYDDEATYTCCYEACQNEKT